MGWLSPLRFSLLVGVAMVKIGLRDACSDQVAEAEHEDAMSAFMRLVDLLGFEDDDFAFLMGLFQDLVSKYLAHGAARGSVSDFRDMWSSKPLELFFEVV